MTTILTGDCIDVMKTMPAESVNCCVTSPPYWGLRDYGVAGQIGLEPTVDVWLEKMVAVFAEVRRVLRADGTLWVNMGDAYDSGTSRSRSPCATPEKHGYWANPLIDKRVTNGMGAKQLLGLPWRVAFALQADGWILRSDIIWHKPNAMPESCKDRPTTAHEHLFLLAKSTRYYYDERAIREPTTGDAHPRGDGRNKKAMGRDATVGAGKWKTPDAWDTSKGDGGHGSFHKDGREHGTVRDVGVGNRARPSKAVPNAPRVHGNRPGRRDGGNACNAPRSKQNESFSAAVTEIVESRNRRTVWTIPTKAYRGAHFATFPPALIRPCILAGCPQGGTVLDPFGGTGTTGMVAEEEGRNSILIELNPAYVKLAEKRTAQGGLFCGVKR